MRLVEKQDPEPVIRWRAIQSLHESPDALLVAAASADVELKQACASPVRLDAPLADSARGTGVRWVQAIQRLRVEAHQTRLAGPDRPIEKQAATNLTSRY